MPDVLVQLSESDLVTCLTRSPIQFGTLATARTIHTRQSWRP